jgi:hypothetical protein
MSEEWHFKCLECEQENHEGLNNGDKILLNVLEHIDDIRNILGSEESSSIQIAITNRGTEPIDFLMEHYGEGHDVVVKSENGQIKRIV